MKKIFLLFFLSCSASLLFGQLPGSLSDAEISFTFLSKKVDGSIAGFRSSSIIDKSDISKSKIKGSVATKTLESGNFLRNWSLKGGKYFDVDTYPTISFEGSSIEAGKIGFRVTGTLTIKAISKPITISFIEEGDRLIGTTTLFSSDFGIEIMKKSREANKVLVKMSFKTN